MFSGGILFSKNSRQTSQTSTYPVGPQTQSRNSRLYANVGLLCAFLALIVLPEVFGLAAAILGAYAYRLDCGTTRNRGLWAVILGVIFMLVGIYYTSFFGLYNILP